LPIYVFFSFQEKPLLSTKLHKYNQRNKRQARGLIITNKAVYNVSKQGMIMSLLSSSYTVKRKIDIGKISGLTVSEMSSEFVIHVKEEYDYRYSSSERREQILLMITRSFHLNVLIRALPFYFKVSKRDMLSDNTAN